MPLTRRSEFRKRYEPLTARFEIYRPDGRSINIPSKLYFGTDNSTYITKHVPNWFSIDLSQILEWHADNFFFAWDVGAPATCTFFGLLNMQGSAILDLTSEAPWGLLWESMFSVAVGNGHELYLAYNDDTSTLRLFAKAPLIANKWSYLEFL